MIPTSDFVRELAVMLDRETHIAAELRQALLDQRAAVAAADGNRVHESVHAISQTLHLLEEARRQRATLLEQVEGRTPADIAAQAAPADRAVLEASRARLRRVAIEVTQAAAINREVLKRAMDAGESFLQELFSSVGGLNPSYRPEDADAPRPGVLVDRTA